MSRGAAAVGAALFDLDGVICDTDRLAQREIRCALEAMGYPVTKSLLDALMGLDTTQTHAWLRRNLDPGLDVAAFSAAVVAGLISAPVGRDFAVPGALALLERLAAVGPVYISTNNEFGIARHYLVGLGIDHIFAGVFACDTRVSATTKRNDVAAVRRRYGLAPGAVIFIDDRLENCRAVAGECRAFWAPAGAVAVNMAGSALSEQVVACETLDCVAQQLFGA